MENDKTMQFPQGEPIYEKPQFMEVNASFVFGTNQESGGRDDGGDGTGSKASEEGEYTDDDY